MLTRGRCNMLFNMLVGVIRRPFQHKNTIIKLENYDFKGSGDFSSC